jgi:hypothetical protein
MLTKIQLRDVMMGILNWTASHDGSVESAEEALVNIQSETKKALLGLGILALDPEQEEAKCVCGFDFFEAEIEVMPGCKCRKCKRMVVFIGG